VILWRVRARKCDGAGRQVRLPYSTMPVKIITGRIEKAMPVRASLRRGRQCRTALRSPMLENTAPSTQQRKAKGNSQINAHAQIDSVNPATATPLPLIEDRVYGEVSMGL